jgi:methylaspartate ammonia-lyase
MSGILTPNLRSFVATVTASLEADAAQMRAAVGTGCTGVDLQRWARVNAAAARLLALYSDHAEAASRHFDALAELTKGGA